jgi:phosphohistidine phosphatase SixA
VLSSPLLRARETAAVIARAGGVEAEVDESLAPGATAESLLACVSGRGARVVAVAHQPDCSLITAALLGEKPPFPPGGMVAIEIADAR